MKSIKILKKLINILFFGMIVFAILFFISFLILIFSPESLPLMFQGYKMLLDTDFPWQIWIVPVTNAIGFILFIISIYYLRKSIQPFQKRDFYSNDVIENLKKSGRLFIIIALGTGFISFISAFAFNTYANFSVIGGNFGNGHKTVALLSALENINFFLLVVGLFLLVFSSAFENGKLLKEENDLTV